MEAGSTSGRRHLNEYLKEVTGSSVTAKDFRTWAGTLLGACALARQGYPAPASGRAVRSRISAAMKETAHLLGNTPTVCRASYVSPQVLSAFEAGRLISDPPALEHLVRASPRVLAAVERKLARILRNGNPARSRAGCRLGGSEEGGRSGRRRRLHLKVIDDPDDAGDRPASFDASDET